MASASLLPGLGPFAAASCAAIHSEAPATSRLPGPSTSAGGVITFAILNLRAGWMLREALPVSLRSLCEMLHSPGVRAAPERP